MTPADGGVAWIHSSTEAGKFKQSDKDYAAWVSLTPQVEPRKMKNRKRTSVITTDY